MNNKLKIWLLGVLLAGACSTGVKSVKNPAEESYNEATCSCNEGQSEMSYSQGAMKVCLSGTNGTSVYDVGCNGKNLEVTANDVSSYLTGGDKGKLVGKRASPNAAKAQKAIEGHKKCLDEIF